MFKVNFATLLIFNYGIGIVERDLYLRGNVLPLKVEIVLGKVLTLENCYRLVALCEKIAVSYPEKDMS